MLIFINILIHWWLTKSIEVKLTNKWWKILMLKIFWKNFISKGQWILNNESISFICPWNQFFCIFILHFKSITFRIYNSFPTNTDRSCFISLFYFTQYIYNVNNNEVRLNFRKGIILFSPIKMKKLKYMWFEWFSSLLREKMIIFGKFIISWFLVCGIRIRLKTAANIANQLTLSLCFVDYFCGKLLCHEPGKKFLEQKD